MPARDTQPRVLAVRKRTVERRFGRVGGADVYPVFCREIIERQQGLTVFGQTLCRFAS